MTIVDFQERYLFVYLSLPQMKLLLCGYFLALLGTTASTKAYFLNSVDVSSFIVDEKSYENNICIHICQSSQELELLLPWRITKSLIELPQTERNLFICYL